MSLRCSIYARYSSDQQKVTSIDDQVRECREAALALRWIVLSDHIYSDEAISGAAADRPGLKRLLQTARIAPRPFDVLLLDDTSRLARNVGDSARIIEELRFLGIRVRAISQGIDSQDEQAEVLWTVHGLVDSLYLKELAKKTHRGLEGAVRRNLHAGGRCYGYQNVVVEGGVELRINQAEAAVVVRIFESAAGGHSLKQIAKTLNADHIIPPRPRKGRVPGGWCPTAIRGMLRRELYIGHQIWNRSTFVKRPGTNKRIGRDRPPSEWVVMERPELRIIDDHLWQRVQNRIEALRAIYEIPGRKGLLQRAATSPYLLTGIAKCGLCGTNIVIVTGRGPSGHAKYGCPHNFNRGTCANDLKERHDRLETRLFSGLQDALLRPAVIEYAVQEFGRQLQQALAEVTDDMARLRSRKESLEGEMRRLTDAIAITGHSDSLLKAIAEREVEIREIDQRILSSRPDSLQSKLNDLRRFVTERLKGIQNLLNEDPVQAKNELVKHVEVVTLQPVGSGPNRHYVAEGNWDLLGEREKRVQVVAGVSSEPVLHFWVLVRPIIVEDQVHGQAGVCGCVDLVQETDKFLVPVPRLALPNDLTAATSRAANSVVVPCRS